MMDFEETLRRLHSWLGEQVSVAVSPSFEGAMVAAVMGGRLARTLEPPEEFKAILGDAGRDEILFFYVEREGGDQRDSFALTRSHFEYAFIQESIAGGTTLAIVLRGILLGVTARDQ
jgi:hypothetical protein